VRVKGRGGRLWGPNGFSFACSYIAWANSRIAGGMEVSGTWVGTRLIGPGGSVVRKVTVGTVGERGCGEPIEGEDGTYIGELGEKTGPSFSQLGGGAMFEGVGGGTGREGEGEEERVSGVTYPGKVVWAICRIG
jgi:hypothetical protein